MTIAFMSEVDPWTDWHVFGAVDHGMTITFLSAIGLWKERHVLSVIDPKNDFCIILPPISIGFKYTSWQTRQVARFPGKIAEGGHT
jgi:hypothetical protein